MGKQENIPCSIKERPSSLTEYTLGARRYTEKLYSTIDLPSPNSDGAHAVLHGRFDDAFAEFVIHQRRVVTYDSDPDLRWGGDVCLENCVEPFDGQCFVERAGRHDS